MTTDAHDSYLANGMRAAVEGFAKRDKWWRNEYMAKDSKIVAIIREMISNIPRGGFTTEQHAAVFNDAECELDNAINSVYETFARRDHRPVMWSVMCELVTMPAGRHPGLPLGGVEYQRQLNQLMTMYRL